MFEEDNFTDFSRETPRISACKKQCRILSDSIFAGCPCIGPDCCKFMNLEPDEDSWFPDMKLYYSQIFSSSERNFNNE